MQTALLLGFEMGTHEIPFHPDSPLCVIFWLVFLFGVAMQVFLLGTKRRKGTRWSLAILLLIGLVVCEIGCQVITGWDALVPIILYFYLLAMLLGAGVCALVVFLYRKKKLK